MSQNPSHSPLPHSAVNFYPVFLDFVKEDCQRERVKVNRKMFWVFIWCFILPAVTLGILMFFMKLSLIPADFRRYTDWIILIFPVSYSLYYLGSEVLVDLPILYKKGGMTSTLRLADEDLKWRNRVMNALTHKTNLSVSEWKWIQKSFEIDIDNLKSRIRYLTILSGAVFFVFMQILDTFQDPSHEVPQMNGGVYFLSRLEAMSSNLTQMTGTMVLLVLFYLSGSQTVAVLKRYLDCLELLSRGEQK